MSKFKIQRPQEKKRARKRTIASFVVVGILLLPFVFGGGWLWFQINAFGNPGKTVSIEIPQGSGLSEIGNVLEQKNVVRSGTAFAFYSKFARRGPYQAGQYKMRTNIDASQAASVMEKGPIINYDKFTIIPGQRLVDIKLNVDKLPKMSAEGFQTFVDAGTFRSKFQPEGSTNLEGLLLPETYQISSTESEGDIIRRSMQEFDARATNVGLEGNYNGFTPYQIITIASLIEKEARYSKDRKIIASVIYNRLAKDMPLQIDATVLYGLGRASGSLSNSDLATDTLFNTYTRKGLVPAPISMISMDSLQAALNPSNTNYLFYVLSDAKTGKHAFANTYEEHLINIQKAQDNGAL